MQLEVKVDEADVGQVKAGQRATFTVDAFPGRRFPAEIIRVDLGANAEASAAASAGSVVAYTDVLSVQNPDLTLRPGMTAPRSEEHTAELQYLTRHTYAHFSLEKINNQTRSETKNS